MVSKSYRLISSDVCFKDYRNGYPLAIEGYPCYTSNDFVTSTTIKEDCVFDMELAYIAAMGFQHLHALKIVSDNLSLHTYREVAAAVE